ncbi:MAG: sensor histidine kinase, partial [Chthoniobacterales bacterium]
VRGRGPFAVTTEDLLSLQLFVIILSIPVLFLAALMEERNDVTQKLREREERIDLAAETANFALWAIDFEQGESWMSERGRELFAFRPNEPLSRAAFLERVHPEDREAVTIAIDHARATSEVFEVEFRLLRPDSDTRWLNARGRYLRNARGEVAELIGVAIDVTDRREAEEANRSLAHAQRLAMIGELTAMIAHEINQPLGAILSNADAAELLLESENPPLDEIREILTDIQKNDLRADKAIRRIRSLLRKREMRMEPLDLNETTADVLQFVAGDALRRRVAIRKEFAKGLPLVLGDRASLEQVLLNLIFNGMDAMKDTPESARYFTVRTKLDGDGCVEVAATDNGCGIPPDRMQRLFESFYTTKEEGMGLGLSIARSIIVAHQGRIWAENNAGGGTIFYFTVPLAVTSSPETGGSLFVSHGVAQD